MAAVLRVFFPKSFWAILINAMGARIMGAVAYAFHRIIQVYGAEAVDEEAAVAKTANYVEENSKVQTKLEKFETKPISNPCHSPSHPTVAQVDVMVFCVLVNYLILVHYV